MTCAPWRHPLVSNVSASPYLTLQGCCCGPPPGASGLQGRDSPQASVRAGGACRWKRASSLGLFQGFLSLEPQGRGDEIFAGAEHRFSPSSGNSDLSGSGTRTDGGLTLDKASQACPHKFVSLPFYFRVLSFLYSY